MVWVNERSLDRLKCFGEWVSHGKGVLLCGRASLWKKGEKENLMRKKDANRQGTPWCHQLLFHFLRVSQTNFLFCFYIYRRKELEWKTILFKAAMSIFLMPHLQKNHVYLSREILFYWHSLYVYYFSPVSIEVGFICRSFFLKLVFNTLF